MREPTPVTTMIISADRGSRRNPQLTCSWPTEIHGTENLLVNFIGDRLAEQLKEVAAGDHEGRGDRQGTDGPDHLLILDLLAEKSVDNGPQQGEEWDEPQFVVHLYLL